MHTEYHRWRSPRLDRDMGLVVFGHYGPPLLGFPTSGGNEWELHDQGLVGALADFIDAGRIKMFCVNSLNGEGFYDSGAHPRRRSWLQSQFDAYVRHEAVPFIHHHCRTPGISIATVGMSLGAYYAANVLFKYPDAIKRCFALSGVYDMSAFMDGVFDENFYFTNPVDYLSSQSDPWFYHHVRSCDIHLATGTGPWENSGPSYALSHVLRSKDIPHHLDDWGPLGGHDWPYWKHQMRQYLSAWVGSQP